MYFFRNKTKGFTLMELLVVVGIIAFITSIIMFFVSNARIKGNDAGIKSNLTTVRSQAEIFYVNNGNSYLPAGASGGFNTACFSTYAPSAVYMFARDKVMQSAIKNAVKLTGLTGTESLIFLNGSRCFNSNKAWAVAVLLRSGNKGPNFKSWCIDSSGQSKQINFQPVLAFNITGTGSTSTAVCK